MGVLENMKDVAELVKKFGDIELDRRILNLENEVLDLSRDKRRAGEKVEELERALTFSKKLAIRDGLYWAGEEKGSGTAGMDFAVGLRPACPRHKSK
jgi:hypothetical protein